MAKSAVDLLKSHHKILTNDTKKHQFSNYTNPLKKYGLVRVKYGFGTGLVRVVKTQGIHTNPRYSIEYYGLVWV